jgi:hypothetical protein
MWRANRFRHNRRKLCEFLRASIVCEFRSGFGFSLVDLYFLVVLHRLGQDCR